jgi:hypothetical protein
MKTCDGDWHHNHLRLHMNWEESVKYMNFLAESVNFTSFEMDI